MHKGLKAAWTTSHPVIHRTASLTLTRHDAGTLFTNLAATGAITFTLPQDAEQGEFFDFAALAAQELRVDPGAAGALYVNGAKQADDAYASIDDEGESFRVVNIGNGDWLVINSIGTITVV